jgi:hypothetical protein
MATTVNPLEFGRGGLAYVMMSLVKVTGKPRVCTILTGSTYLCIIQLERQ